jgi:hypothetical protein
MATGKNMENNKLVTRHRCYTSKFFDDGTFSVDFTNCELSTEKIKRLNITEFNHLEMSQLYDIVRLYFKRTQKQLLTMDGVPMADNPFIIKGGE